MKEAPDLMLAPLLTFESHGGCAENKKAMNKYVNPVFLVLLANIAFLTGDSAGQCIRNTQEVRWFMWNLSFI